jgi:uncharacterized coiled-coil protein SlyX
MARERDDALASAARAVAAANAEKQEALLAQGRAEGAAEELTMAVAQQRTLAEQNAAEVRRLTEELDQANGNVRILAQQALDAEKRAAEVPGLQRDVADRQQALDDALAGTATAERRISELTAEVQNVSEERDQVRRDLGEQLDRLRQELTSEIETQQQANQALAGERDALAREKQTAERSSAEHRDRADALLRALAEGGFVRADPQAPSSP